MRRPQEEARSALEKKAAMIHLAGPIPGRFGFSVALNITIGSETGARRVSLLLLSGEKLVSIVTSREGGLRSSWRPGLCMMHGHVGDQLNLGTTATKWCWILHWSVLRSRGVVLLHISERK